MRFNSREQDDHDKYITHKIRNKKGIDMYVWCKMHNNNNSQHYIYINKTTLHCRFCTGKRNIEIQLKGKRQSSIRNQVAITSTAGVAVKIWSWLFFLLLPLLSNLNSFSKERTSVPFISATSGNKKEEKIGNSIRLSKITERWSGSALSSTEISATT